MLIHLKPLEALALQYFQVCCGRNYPVIPGPGPLSFPRDQLYELAIVGRYHSLRASFPSLLRSMLMKQLETHGPT